ncbi:MAG: sulfoxide reductase heme-binding subunit YedZ [Hyphomicrobiales bacterium]|nr:sulfoxide reductase heme-binding subunit YedZ [Hyphomicrobiales bacterium]
MSEPLSLPRAARWIDKGLFGPVWLVPVKAAVFVLCLWPLARLGYAGLFDPLALGANPAETIIRSLGDWTIRFLLIGLAISPLRSWTGINHLIAFRRMLGLFAFAYACAHLLAYLAFDRLFQWGEIVQDVIKRPFIAVGFIAFCLLLPLAVTSTRGWVLRLGGARWALLHRLVYPIAFLGVLHDWWLVKRDLTWPLIYAVIVALEMLARVRPVKSFLKQHSPFQQNIAGR